MEFLLSLLKTLRPRQWLKNLALFAPLLFSGFLFDSYYLWITFESMMVFILLSGATYIFNDLKDVNSDRLHPFKRKRPIASGDLPVPVAITVMFVVVAIALMWAYTVNYFFYIACLGYLMIQIAYTSYLKSVPIIDVIMVASGYLLRIYAGGLSTGLHMDVWFLLTVISASLFLAIGKRRSEMTLLAGSNVTAQVRQTLKRYTEDLLGVYTSMFATATWLTYALFTFNHPAIVPHGRILTLMSSLPRTLLSEKLLMATTPLVIYGVMRYLQLIYEKNEGESPERILLSDKPLMLTVILWGLLTVGLIYIVG